MADESGTGVLTIATSRLRDSGGYTAQVQNVHGEKNVDFVVYVSEKPGNISLALPTSSRKQCLSRLLRTNSRPIEEKLEDVWHQKKRQNKSPLSPFVHCFLLFEWNPSRRPRTSANIISKKKFCFSLTGPPKLNPTLDTNKTVIFNQGEDLVIKVPYTAKPRLKEVSHS